MRHLLSIVLVVCTAASSVARAMCPFCPPASITLSEQVAESDAVVLGSWIKRSKAEEASEGVTTFEVVSTLKDYRKAFKAGAEVTVPEDVPGQVGNLFLLFGKALESDSDVLTWETPKPISEIGYQYVKQAPAPETPKDKRLRYFIKFLEYPDPLLADDAYSEFAGAEYEDLVLIKDAFSRERIRKWITDEDTLAPRLGLYGLMLGLCGNEHDVKLLEGKIRDEADKTRLGIDGIMGGYLLLTGVKGMDLLEETKINNSKAPLADVHSLMSALRFLWQYGQDIVPKDRLRSAVRRLLDRQEVADMAIADLARWKDWSVQDRLMGIYKKGDPSNPLGEISTRHAVIRYMIASTLDKPETGDVPVHVIQAQQHLETLRKLDPKAVQRAERLMLPRPSEQ